MGGDEIIAFMNGIIALQKRVQRDPEPILTGKDTGKRPLPDHAGALILDFPAVRTLRNKFLFIGYSVCGILE